MSPRVSISIPDKCPSCQCEWRNATSPHPMRAIALKSKYDVVCSDPKCSKRHIFTR